MYPGDLLLSFPSKTEFLCFRRPFTTAALVFVVHLHSGGSLMYRHWFANIHRRASINARGEDGRRQELAQRSSAHWWVSNNSHLPIMITADFLAFLKSKNTFVRILLLKGSDIRYRHKIPKIYMLLLTYSRGTSKTKEILDGFWTDLSFFFEAALMHY